MVTCGIDVVSLTAKAVVLDVDSGRILGRGLGSSSAGPEKSGQRVMAAAFREAGLGAADVQSVVGTGYGRSGLSLAGRRVTEITCHARGVHHLLREARTVIDVGGQDSKAIRTDGEGRALDFEMNDRCAAGTGRFLEIMAGALGVGIRGFSGLAGTSTTPLRVSSTCTVFAESEVVALLAQGSNRADVAAGLCAAVAQRIAAMVWRLGLEPPVAFTGGVALNTCVKQALELALGTGLSVPAEPQMTGALGAALLAAEGSVGSACLRL